MSGSINKGSSIKITWRSGTPLKVLIVRPYLVGLMEDSIEIKCMFNPNRVVQIITDQWFANWHVAVSSGIIEDSYLTKLDSLFVYSYEKDEDEAKGMHGISELVQVDGKIQVSDLIENQLYSTAIKVCSFSLIFRYANF